MNLRMLHKIRRNKSEAKLLSAQSLYYLLLNWILESQNGFAFPFGENDAGPTVPPSGGCLLLSQRAGRIGE